MKMRGYLERLMTEISESMQVHSGGRLNGGDKPRLCWLGMMAWGWRLVSTWQNSPSLGLQIVRILTMQSGQQIG